MDIIKGHDDKDMTSLPDEDVNYVNNLSNNGYTASSKSFLKLTPTTSIPSSLHLSIVL